MRVSVFCLARFERWRKQRGEKIPFQDIGIRPVALCGGAGDRCGIYTSGREYTVFRVCAAVVNRADGVCHACGASGTDHGLSFGTVRNTLLLLQLGRAGKLTNVCFDVTASLRCLPIEKDARKHERVRRGSGRWAGRCQSIL